jgi:hypothetical protein
MLVIAMKFSSSAPTVRDSSREGPLQEHEGSRDVHLHNGRQDGHPGRPGSSELER